MSKPPDERSQNLVTPPKVTPSIPNISTGFDPQLINRVLQITEREAEVRVKEVELEKQVRTDAHDYAKLALTTQAQDRKDERNHKKSERRDRMYFSSAVIIVLAVFLVVLIYLGQVELARQVASHIGLLIAGAYGGYSYGMRKAEGKKDDDD